ncbi:MAG: Mur ligase [Proteobacteria bacterium]|nr:Mur ligase [Pseudomonadota bacterium]
MSLPFTASRRLTGANLFFPSPGVQLETAGIDADAGLLAGWRARVRRACDHLGWDGSRSAARLHQGGASLALSAPWDLLFLATEVNEWALCATVHRADPARWQELESELTQAALADAADPATVIPPVLQEAQAFARFDALAAREAQPALIALLQAARQHSLPWVLDEDCLTLGAGDGGRDFARRELPAPAAIDWSTLHDIPTVVVTGSNGKTTTVRLLAACAQEQGWPAAYCCTEGVYFEGKRIEGGDYSGPMGARRVIRTRAAHCAVIETARGGILRRGLAVTRAQVALVTNVSADHFGEYGIDDLSALTDVKLSVAGLLPPQGLLVLNADDERLMQAARGLPRRFGHPFHLGLAALDFDHDLLRARRARGGPTCGVREGRLLMHTGAQDHDLGAVVALPLTVGAAAAYNISNLAGAALAAQALGIEAAAIARVFARFGMDPQDNPGRMTCLQHRGAQVLLDYAHNPAGLRGLLTVARSLLASAAGAGDGRLALLLGHAGNRQDADLTQLAQVAAGFRPDLVVIKENESHLRGREAGQVPQILRQALLDAGLSAQALMVCDSELAAARYALAWAQPGDVLAMPVHALQARERVLALLSAAP